MNKKLKSNYLPTWHYNNELVFDMSPFPTNAFGFIYKISYKDNTYYIGKKVFWNYDKKLTTTRKSNRIVVGQVKQRRNGKLVTKDIVKTQSDWLKYVGSSKLDITKTKEIKSREILEIAYSPLHLTFLENKYLYNHLLDENCLNDNISGKIFKGKVLKSISSGE